MCLVRLARLFGCFVVIIHGPGDHHPPPGTIVATNTVDLRNTVASVGPVAVAVEW